MAAREAVLQAAREVAVGDARVPLLGAGNIWVEDSVTNRSSTLLVQSIMLQAIENTAPGQLRVIVYDAKLSGIAAPFSGMNAAGDMLLESFNDAREFAAALARLKAQVQSANDVIQGRAANLADFRDAVDYPVEQYYLAVVAADIATLAESEAAALNVLLKAGPAAGVSFLVHSMLLGVDEYVPRRCTVLCPRGPRVMLADGDERRPIAREFAVPSADELIAASASVARRLRAAALDAVDFTSVQPLDENAMWRESSIDGITCAIGRYGTETVELTLGDEFNQRHNALITGAVGQGKSNLIMTVVHSLCERYSPDELELYLLDFKEGVTLRPFCEQENGEFLPHARVVGLEADREFGLSVLEHLFGVYRKRLRLFKDDGVQNIRKYRERHPEARLPRILLVIDEFQLMLSERDSTSDRIAELLTRGVRLFRAAGIHVLMASQTLDGTVALAGSAGEGLFAQVPVRIALKNSLAESHATLGPKNDAAAYVRAREAIVNLDYGMPQANRRTSIAYADEAVLAPARRLWRRSAPNARAPFVFAGDRVRAWRDDVEPWRDADPAWGQAPSTLAGARIEVGSTPLDIPMGRDAGRNIALFGSGPADVELAALACGIAAQTAACTATTGRRVRFVVLDAMLENAEWAALRARMERALAVEGCSVEFVGRADIPAAIERIAAEYAPAALDGGYGGPGAGMRFDSSFGPDPESFFAGEASDARGRDAALGAERAGSAPEAPAEDTFLLGFGLDRVSSMPESFQTLCLHGPAAGAHVIGWWRKLGSFTRHAGYDGLAAFDARIVFRLEQRSIKEVTGDPLCEFKPAENRALAWDVAFMNEPATIIPYGALAR